MKNILLASLFSIILIASAALHPFTADMRALELFGEARAVVLQAGPAQIGIVYAPGIALLYIGRVDEDIIYCRMVQIAGARVKGEVIDGVYGAGTEKMVPCNLTRQGRSWRGWIDFRGHHRPFFMRQDYD
jgi:hypothetical protein